MSRAALAVVVVAVGALAVSVTSAEGPLQLKVLGTGKAGAAGRFVSVEPPTKFEPVPDLPVSVRSAVVTGMPKLTTPAQTFSLGPTALRAPAQNGLTPGLQLVRPTLVTKAAAFFADQDSSIFSVQNIPPGSWFVDCTLGAVDTTPFNVRFGDGSVSPTVDSVPPQSGHLVLGLLVKTKGQLQLSRTQSWATPGCKFEAN